MARSLRNAQLLGTDLKVGQGRTTSMHLLRCRLTVDARWVALFYIIIISVRPVAYYSI